MHSPPYTFSPDVPQTQTTPPIESRGMQQHTRPLASPMPSLPLKEEDSPFRPSLVFPTMSHAFTGFNTCPQCAPSPDGNSPQAINGAETCLTGRSNDFHLIPSNKERLPPPFPQNSAFTHGLSNSV
jgi:hypothetical protein